VREHSSWLQCSADETHSRPSLSPDEVSSPNPHRTISPPDP
jgi:hypothetical protein